MVCVSQRGDTFSTNTNYVEESVKAIDQEGQKRSLKYSFCFGTSAGFQDPSVS
jgi:hypothetical protein